MDERMLTREDLEGATVEWEGLNGPVRRRVKLVDGRPWGAATSLSRHRCGEWCDWPPLPAELMDTAQRALAASERRAQMDARTWAALVAPSIMDTEEDPNA